MPGTKYKSEHETFGDIQQDPLISFLHRIIRFAVRVLAILMVVVILWGIADVVWVLYQHIIKPPIFLLDLQDILAVFGAFLTVLIAIEIFVNITLYLRDDVIHVKLVVATALMAIARKVIVFDYELLTPHYIWGTAAVVLALGLTYWLLSARGTDAREAHLVDPDRLRERGGKGEREAKKEA